MVTGTSAVAAELFQRALARMHLCRPAEVATVLAEELERALDASDVVTYLVNHEQTALRPVASPRSPRRPEQPIDGTLAGRAFASMAVVVAAAEQPGRRRVWLPVIDGTDRLGVLEVAIPVPDTETEDVPVSLVTVLERFAHITAQSVMTKAAYGDVFEQVQRSTPMSVGAELVQSVLPPLTYATDGLVISAMLEPVYDNGGDAFDYAVNDGLAHLAVFDGMGHGVAAAGLSTFAVAAYRNSRRAGLGLSATYSAMDAAVADQFAGEERFVTAVLAELELATGRLEWVTAGHPPPLLVRAGRVVKLLECPPATPLGVPFTSGELTVAEEHLEPEDIVVLYTDGLTEARGADGRMLEVDGLAEFIRREALSERAAPETLRRLRHTLLLRQNGVLRDDATALVLDWRRGTEKHLLPATVPGRGENDT